MDLFELDLFVDAISKYLKLNQPFTVLQGKKGLSWEPAYSVELHRDLESIQIFSDYLIANVGPLNFRELPEDYFYKIRALVSLLDKFIKNRKGKYNGLGSEVFEEADHKIFALRLGGKIDFREIPGMDRELYNFIKINELDQKLFALGIQLNKLIALPFEIEANMYEEIEWNKLVRKELSDSIGRVYGYRFFYSDHLVMETNGDLLLTEQFSLLYRGISLYHPIKALHIAAIDKKEPSAWKHKNLLEVITLNKRGSLLLMLRKEDGNLFCIGVSKGKLSSPVNGCFVEYKCLYQMAITKEEFALIFKILEDGKFYKKSFNEKDLLSVVQESLKLSPLPEKMLLSKNMFLAYLLLPYGIVKFFCARKKYPCFGWKDLFKTPYKISRMNKKRVIRWLKEASITRSGEEKCFE